MNLTATAQHISPSRHREVRRGCHAAGRPTERSISRNSTTRHDTFTHNGNQTRIKTSTGIWLATYNALNRPVRFESADGTTVITYTYSPFGAVTADGDVQQPIQWSSEVWNSELALVYYNYRYYNAVDGKWIQRDFPEETVGFNLYSYVLNTPVNSSDYIGLWEIRHSSQSATAEAIAECGDTWKVLAESVGLLVTEAAHWVGGYTTFPRKGRTYTVPNTIISYWVGDVGGVGRWWVDWDYNNRAFEKANYHVKKYIANVSTKYANILNAESKGKTLPGTYYWGHGVYNTKTNRAVALLERDEYNYSYFNDFNLLYHMQFAFIFACDSIQGKNALKSIHYRGFEGVLVPWNPWRPIYTKPSDYVE